MERSEGIAGKMNSDQASHVDEVVQAIDGTLRVMSFNMLFNKPWAEKDLARENRWIKRGPRVIEYLKMALPDVIGSQELQKDQIDMLMDKLGCFYAYYGVGTDGQDQGDIAAIFYRKDRLELLEGSTFFYSATPCVPSKGPFRSRNTFTVCRFADLKTGQECVMINTHLAYGNIERRLYEARLLRDFVQGLDPCLPVIVTGDFNTFPNRPDLELPFYDGIAIMRVIEEGCLEDALERAVLGHVGPISSTNFSSEKRRAFENEGSAGVILDHIFVNDEVEVVRHGIDPAQVNGHYPSDHFPVIADVLMHRLAPAHCCD